MPHANASEQPEPQWAAFVAIDWADKKHHWKLCDAASQQCQQGELKNSPEALEDWAAELAARYDGRPLAVCLEQSRGAVVYQLSKYPHLVLFPVHPNMAAQFRKALYPSGAKSDAGDSAALLDLLMHHRDRLRRLDPDTAETRLLQLLVEQRRVWVNEKTRQSNRLTNWLKMYFPQALDWIDDIDSELGCDLLARWPTLEQLQRAHRQTLLQFFRAHNCRSKNRIEQRLEAIYAATPAVRDTAVLQGGALAVKQIIGVIRALRRNVEELDTRIAELTDAHPDRAIFASLPGVGPALLPRLIVAFGTKRARYDSAYDLQCYSGIGPVTVQSGNTKWVHFRWGCPKFLRQTFHEFAAHSLAEGGWARAYYDGQRADRQQRGTEGKGGDHRSDHHAAVRALAYKWIRVLFRCWQDRAPYDEAKYVESLRKRGSPLAQKLATTLAWKEDAGFFKVCRQNG